LPGPTRDEAIITDDFAVEQRSDGCAIDGWDINVAVRIVHGSNDTAQTADTGMFNSCTRL